MQSLAETADGPISETYEGESPNPSVFIIGCIRSGTTLLQRLVNAHPALAIVHETHWIPRLYKNRTGLTPEGLVTSEFIDYLCAHDRFSHLGMERTEIERLLTPGEAISYAAFVSRIFDLYASAHGKRLAGDKTPAYVKNVAFLHTLWPKTKFVHLIRDGRDVALSIMNWNKACNNAGRHVTWSEDPVSTTALYWRRKVQLGREGGSSLDPELYYEIRYEAMVTDPQGECTKLCAFLNLPYDETMLHFHEGRTRQKPGLDAKHAWLPVTPGLRDWTSQMTSEQIERFEAVAGDLLSELGYARAFPQPSTQAMQHAARMRERFTEDLRAREDRLPKKW